jgi:hypothetical protein
MIIHPEFYRAMQATRLEDIARAAARRHVENNLDRSTWPVRLRRAVAAGVAAGRLAFAEAATLERA